MEGQNQIYSSPKDSENSSLIIPHWKKLDSKLKSSRLTSLRLNMNFHVVTDSLVFQQVSCDTLQILALLNRINLRGPMHGLVVLRHMHAVIVSYPFSLVTLYITRTPVDN